MPELPEMFDMTGRTVIVTGGPGLLGSRFSHTLAEVGANVVVADINEAAAKAEAEKLVGDGLKAIGVGVDVTSQESTEGLVQQVLDTYGSVDVLINSAALDPKFDKDNAGKHGSDFESFPLDMWQQSLDVNLTGLFLCSQAVSKPMLEQGKGVIINICSTYGLVGPDQRLYEREGEPPQFKPVTYTVTKAGVVGLTKYLATYYAGKNIRVNALSPGGVFNEHDDEFVERYSSRTVMGRMAEQDEMSGAILFLASDASSYMTGSNLVVDGGWTAW